MPVMQVRNAEAQALGYVDHLRTDDRNFAGEWYDSGNLSAGFVAATPMLLPAVRHNSAPEVYAMASNVLTIAEAGLYLFDYTLFANPPSTTHTSFYCYLEQDPATGVFAAVPASMSVGVTISGSSGAAHTSVLLRVGINYRYRVMAATFGVTHTMVGSSGGNTYYGSRLSVVRLFKNG